MRTLIEKPKTARQTASVKPAVPARSSGQSGDVFSVPYLQRMIGNQGTQRALEDRASGWSADGAGVREVLYRGRPCESPEGTGGAIGNRSVTALAQTFNILAANAGVNSNFRPPQATPSYMITLNGPSFSMFGRVQAPPTLTGYRLGVIQQVLPGQMQAHYENLTRGTPMGHREWTCGAGLDIDRGSTPPWYDSSRTVPMDPVALTGLSDEPGMNNLLLIVNDQGGMGGTPEGKLAQFAGCLQFRVWLVIEAPDGAREAIARAEWVANFNIAYNTVFTSLSAGPPITSATSSASTGWMTSPLQVGAGEPIPTTTAPACVDSWISSTDRAGGSGR